MKVIPVSQCLDKRLLLLGLEMADLLVVFLSLSILYFIFGQTNHKLLLVWSPPLLLAALFKYGKKGRPENYLLHFVRYQISPGRFCAFLPPSVQQPAPKLKKGEN